VPLQPAMTAFRSCHQKVPLDRVMHFPIIRR
jgi:hypothetical protein